MHFHLPRRHRRHLLFPPGLLALAGLLWLGCGAMRPWQEHLTPRYYVSLSTPPIPVSDTILPAMRIFSGYLTKPFLYSQLYSLYTWQDVVFNGDAAHDSSALSLISQSIQRMRVDTIPNGGIRIRVSPPSKYKELIRLLDLMTSVDQKKYLIDFYHGPLTVYVLVDSYTPPSDASATATPISPGFLCGTNLATPQVQQHDLGISTRNILFQQPEWQASLWLLAAIAAISSWRLFQLC